MTGLVDPIASKYDPVDPEVLADPFEMYRIARDSCPVSYHKLPQAEVDKLNDNPLVAEPTEGYFSVFRYADVKAIAQNHRRFSSLQGAGGPERIRALNEVGMLVYADEPHHRMQRQIVNKAFSPRRVAQLEPRVRQVCENLVDRFSGEGRADLVLGYANAIPGTIFSELLGVPPSDQAQFKRWAEELVAAFGGDAESYQRSARAMEEISAYFGQIIGERRQALADDQALPDDLLSALLVSDYEGRTFNDLEMLLAIHVFLIGGHETTAAGIAGSIYQFATNADQLRQVSEDRSLLHNAVEEVLRMETPVQCMFRTSHEDTTIADVPIPHDEKIRILYGSANRDPVVFSRPEDFDVTRNVTELRKHLAFGTGIHACVGAALARSEMRIALEVLLDKLGHWELDPDRPSIRGDGLLVRRFSTLNVRWTSTKEPSHG